MAELLVSNNDANTQQIGEVVDVKPDGHVWGGREGLPNYVHITITDATREQAMVFLDRWEIVYKLTEQVNNPQRIRYRIEVDESSISSSGIGRDQLKDDMQGWAERLYGGTALAFTPEQFTVDIPKPFDTTKFAADFADIWNTVFDIRRYKFTQADVSAAVAAGGSASYTLADALARVIDKLDG